MGTTWKDRNDDGFLSSERTVGCFQLLVEQPALEEGFDWHVSVGEDWLAASSECVPLDEAKKACEEAARKLAQEVLNKLIPDDFDENRSYGGTD